ncbi:MAG: sensor domain-containing diguanylate cyclase [Deltaproteobacteria bacterium]|nr:sensor domain-containing diguanylate cyclase [Deltaproteobacteria bacterium]
MVVDQILAAVISGLPDPAAVVREDHKIVRCNRPFLALASLNYVQMQRRIREGISLGDIVRANDGEDVECLRRCLSEDKVFRLAEVSARTARGQELVLWQAFIPIKDGDSAVRHAIVIVRDVSSEARVQERFRELVASAEARAEDLEFLVAQRTRELSSALEEVTRLSQTDPLTGLANRRAFFDTATREVEAALRYRRPFSILMCDLDHFKQVNDVCGHQMGDRLLVSCADALRGALRRSDFLARFGGEEFIALLLECTPASALVTAERCRQNITTQPACATNGLPRPMTASFGIASFPKDSEDLATLIQCADSALYAAKASGRNAVAAYQQPSTISAPTPPTTSLANEGKE